MLEARSLLGTNSNATPTGTLLVPLSWLVREPAAFLFVLSVVLILTSVRAPSHCARCRRSGGDVDVTSFNWTYTAEYDGDLTLIPPAGTCGAAAAVPEQQQASAASRTLEPVSGELPLDRLRHRGAILFYAEVTLYEDELHDRGHVECKVKVRVMEDCFLVLARTYLRVDRQRVWLRDVRWYHEFGEPALLKDVQLREGPTSLFTQVRQAHGHCTSVRVSAPFTWKCNFAP